MIHILHLISDPSIAARLAGACDKMHGFDNAFVLLRQRLENTDTCIQTEGRVKVVVAGSAEYRALLRCPADLIWVHGAYTMSIRFVLAYKGDAKIAWSALGSDYFGYIGRIDRHAGLKLRIAHLFVKMHCFWMLPSEHMRFFRRVDFLSIRDKRDKTAVIRLLSSIVRTLPFIYDSFHVKEHEAAFIARTIDPWAGAKALGGTGTVRFDANGGIGSMSEIYCENGAVPRLPANAFFKKNYVFSGWALSPDGTVTWGDRALAAGLPFVNGAVKLYARWGKTRCEVRFHGNGGGGKMPPFTFTHGVPTLLPGNVFVRTGFCFKGWSHIAGGKILWRDGSPISEPMLSNGVADLFAVWSNELPQGTSLPAGFYGIRFHSNDGTGRSVVWCFKHKTVSQIPTVMDLGWKVPDGEFLGWSLSLAGAAIVYSDGGKSFAPVSPGKTMDIYAIWHLTSGRSVGQTVRICFNANGGNGTMLPLTVPVWTPIKSPECSFEWKFTSDEYSFRGWALSPNGEPLWQDGDEIELPPMKDGEITLYAKWKGFPCRVVFDRNGGSGQMDDFSMIYGEPARLPSCTFTRRLYVFDGWAASPQDQVIWEDGGEIREPPFREGKIVLFAKWRGAQVKVSFDANGGDGQMSDMVFDYDPDMQLPEAAFSRPMRNCVGWSYSPRGPVAISDGGVLGNAPFRNGMLTLYAQWRNKTDKTKRARGTSETTPQHHLGRKIRILHIVSARLFVDGIISTFDRFEETENDYVLLHSEQGVYSTEGIRQRQRVEIIKRDSPRYKELLEAKHDVLWGHGAGQDLIRYCLNCKYSPVIVWSVWGYDYVNYVRDWFYGPKTTLQWLLHEPKKLVLRRLFLWGLAMMRLSRLSRSEHGRFFRKVDFFSTVVAEEEPVLRTLLGNRPKWMFYAYLQKFEDAPKSSRLIDLDKKGVWVGNSATLSNNYWDVFPLIAKTPDREVVVPLVYGTDGLTRGPYAEPIENLGRKLFGDRFTAISTFLPLDEYTALMNKCSAFVFGHRRQQAAGNIWTAMRNGGCVFLDKRSPIYKVCIRKKFKVYTLEDLNRGIDTVLADFKNYQAENVRRVSSTPAVRELLAKIHKSILQVKGECERRRKQKGDSCNV